MTKWKRHTHFKGDTALRAEKRVCVSWFSVCPGKSEIGVFTQKFLFLLWDSEYKTLKINHIGKGKKSIIFNEFLT